ncbi:MAG TPA: PIN domain-containing protein [Gemmatimonadales bacterium]|nr:PIN domain-containing protein [Gemmatimonadales bacterium]
MNAYLDSSIILRVVLGQPARWEDWSSVTLGIASGLVEVECLGTLDRLRQEGALTDEELALRRETVYRLLEEMELVEPTTPVLRRAAQPLPVPLGTLDAIHLATALLWRETRRLDLVIATHDRALALAARANGLRAVGV